MGSSRITNLYSAHICILRSVLVLVKSIFGKFAFLEINAKFDKLQHHRLKGADGTVSGPLRIDMFVQYGEGGRGLPDGDELLRSL